MCSGPTVKTLRPAEHLGFSESKTSVISTVFQAFTGSVIPGLLLGAEPELGVDDCRVPLCEQKIKTALNDQSGAHSVQ